MKCREIRTEDPVLFKDRIVITIDDSGISRGEEMRSTLFHGIRKVRVVELNDAEEPLSVSFTMELHHTFRHLGIIHSELSERFIRESFLTDAGIERCIIDKIDVAPLHGLRREEVGP